MAFQTAAGYGNLPNGNFSPTIFSKKAQMAFRKKSLAKELTSNEYFGEISNFGDTVRIIKEPDITVGNYARGKKVVPQDLDDGDFSLTIDKANDFSFRVDDIEEKHSHVTWMSLASDRASYKMSDQMDMEVLGYMAGFKQSATGLVADTVNDQVSGSVAVDGAGTDELLSSMKLNKGKFTNITTSSAADHSIPLGVRLPGATANPTAFATCMMVVNRMGRQLDLQNVPKEGRFLVVDPVFEEILRDEDSRFHNADYGPNGSLRTGDVPLMISGFKMYCSNNLPSVGTGAVTSGTANQNANYGVIVASHSSAVATAQQINKVEKFRDPDSFADIVRGMNLYGRKILRPESIVTAKYNVA